MKRGLGIYYPWERFQILLEQPWKEGKKKNTKKLSFIILLFME